MIYLAERVARVVVTVCLTRWFTILSVTTMSEYWVSKKKYFCRYCEVYIADDVPSRQQHENGLRHKGNTERFIRNLYKTGEKRKKELDDEKREMARVEKVRPLVDDTRLFSPMRSHRLHRPPLPRTSVQVWQSRRHPVALPPRHLKNALPNRRTVMPTTPRQLL